MWNRKNNHIKVFLRRQNHEIDHTTDHNFYNDWKSFNFRIEIDTTNFSNNNFNIVTMSKLGRLNLMFLLGRSLAEYTFC